jgi:hypothetical protein
VVLCCRSVVAGALLLAETGVGANGKHFEGTLDLKDISAHATEERHEQTALVDAEVHEQGWSVGLSLEEHRVELSIFCTEYPSSRPVGRAVLSVSGLNDRR